MSRLLHQLQRSLISLTGFGVILSSLSLPTTPLPGVERAKAQQQTCKNADIVIALDRSNSMKDRYPGSNPATSLFDTVKAGAIRLANSFESNGQSLAANEKVRLGLVTFATSSRGDLDLTTDYAGYKATLNNLKIPNNQNPGTELDAGIRDAHYMLNAGGRTRKVMIVFSDGGNSDGGATVLKQAKAARQAGIEVFSLHYDNKGAHLSVMQQVASTNGGVWNHEHFYSSKNATDPVNLETVFETIANAIQNSCQPLTHCAIDMSFVIDQSDSMDRPAYKGDKTKKITEANDAMIGMINYFQAVNTSPGQIGKIRGSYIQFNYDAHVVRGMTDDMASLRSSISEVTKLHSNLGDGIRASISQFANPPRVPEHQAVIFMSDGRANTYRNASGNIVTGAGPDDGKHGSADDYYKTGVEALRNQVGDKLTLYTIGYGKAAGGLAIHPHLMEAESNGGLSDKYYFANEDSDDVTQLTRIFEEIKNDICVPTREKPTPSPSPSTSPPVSQCSVVLEKFELINPPVDRTYKPGDSFSVLAQINNKSNQPASLNMTVTATSTPSVTNIVTLDKNNVKPPGSMQADTTASPIRLRSSSAINPGVFSLTLPFKVATNVPLLTTVQMGATLVSTVGGQNCTDDSKKDGFTFKVQPPGDQCDFQAIMTASASQVKRDDIVTYAIQAKNAGSSAISNKNITVKIVGPQGLTHVSHTPNTGYGETTVGNQKEFAWKHLVANLAPGASTGLFTLKVKASLPDGSYKVTGSVGSTECTDNDSGNNEVIKDLIIGNNSNLVIEKYWKTSAGLNRDPDVELKPGQTVSFLVRAKAVSGTEANVNLGDFLHLNNETTSDSSLVWQDPLPAGISRVAGNDQRLRWTAASLTTNWTEWTLTAKVADQNTLIQKVAQFGDGPRCNSFGRVVANELNTLDSTTLCWIYDQKEVKADLSITKTASAATIRQGDIGRYTLTAKNNSNFASLPASMQDTQEDTPPSHSVNSHTIKWLNPAGGTVDSANPHKITWDLGTLNANQSVTRQPEFGVACDASVNSYYNYAWVFPVDGNPGNNSVAVPVAVQVVPGTYELKAETSLSEAIVAPGQETVFSLVLRNDSNVSNTVPIPQVSATTKIPPGLEVVGFDPAGSGTATGDSVNGYTVTWKTVPSIAKNSSAPAMKVRLKATNFGFDRTIDLYTETQSITDSATCTTGDDQTITQVRLATGTQVRLLKKVSSAEVEATDTFSFTLDLTNDAGGVQNGPYVLEDELDAALVYQAGSEQCQGLASGDSCTPQVSQNNGKTVLRWNIGSIQPKATAQYRFNVQPNAGAQFIDCPAEIVNLAKLSQNGALLQQGQASVKIYAGKCVKGNIFAQGTQSQVGLGLNGQDIKIDQNSILSSGGTINCGSASCTQAPWKVGDYNTANSVGLAFKAVVQRMQANIARIAPRATVGMGPNLTSAGGSINFYDKSNTTDRSAGTRYPEGRVWVENSSVTINTDKKMVGRGTVIIYGDLTIEGSGKLEYEDPNRDSIGFIVLPKNGAGGKITVKPGVTRLAGAYYAPGTASGSVSSCANPGSPGTITIEGPGSNRLYVKGMLIGCAFKIDRQALTMEYDARIGNPLLAPPGFSFTSLPFNPDEGS